MTIVEDQKEPEKADELTLSANDDAVSDGEKGNDAVFSQENIASTTEVPAEEVASESVLSIGAAEKPIEITVSDKVAFIDSVVNNTRFERTYRRFGGRLVVTVRSLTAGESQALSAWALKQGSIHPSMQLTGVFRKFLLTAQVSKFNGVDIPPLEKPLFETLEKDGKTITPPAWVDKCTFWDDKSAGVVQAVVDCLVEFDRLYTTLCKKAEDENFWNPDTP